MQHTGLSGATCKRPLLRLKAFATTCPILARRVDETFIAANTAFPTASGMLHPFTCEALQN
eukprot:5727685-Prorocentrum_lima.AAC.1